MIQVNSRVIAFLSRVLKSRQRLLDNNCETAARLSASFVFKSFLCTGGKKAGDKAGPAAASSPSAKSQKPTTREAKFKFQPLTKTYPMTKAKAAGTEYVPGLIAKGAPKGAPIGGDDQEMSDDEAAQNSWRTMKYTLIAMGVSAICGATYLILELGKPPIDDDGKIINDEFSHLPPWKQYISRTLHELDYYKRLIKEPSRDKLLPDVMTYPYYQPPYTLILELTDVLVHPEWTYKTGWRFKKRPGIDHFLESLGGVYEIVVYTAEQGITVFPIMEALDPKNVIAYKLVRDATHFVDGHHVKNLDKLNRDLNKVVVVDWNMDSVKFHPENVFHIPRWNGNENDTTLIDLAAFLRTIAQSEIADVREVLKYYSDFSDPLKTFREKQKKLIELEEAERENKLQNTPQTKKWTLNFLAKIF